MNANTVETAAADLVIDGLNIAERVAEIKEQGYTIVEAFITPEEVARIRHAFDTEVPITEMRAIGTSTGKTWRAHNLLAKTRAVDYLFLDSRIRALVEGVLGKHTQVNVTTLFNVLPGETRQFLHQDDGLWPIPRPHPHFVCNALIALDDYDIENGATHIVPYSHKWYDRKPDQNVETLQVEMRSGSMLMWEGGLWHGGGANNSKDRERLGFFMSHNVAYLRPQEIQLVSVPREVARELPEQLLRLLGYHRFGIGVDGRDPIDVLRDGDVVNPHAQLAASYRGVGSTARQAFGCTMAPVEEHPTVDAVFDRLQAYVDESDRSSPPVFVGREDELAALHRAVDRVATTNPRSMTKLVQGIAGAGKTSLCHEFISQVNGEYVNGHPIVAMKLAPSDLSLDPLALVAKLTAQMPARMDVMPGKSRFMSAVRREASRAGTAALMLTTNKSGYELTNKEHGLSNRSDLGTCIDVYARRMWAKDVVVVLAVDEMQNCPVTEASRSNLLVLNECLHDGRILLVGFGLQNTARKVREELGLSRLSRGAEIEVGPLRTGEGRAVVEGTFDSLEVTTQSGAWLAYVHEAGFTTPSWMAWRDSLVDEVVGRSDDFPHHLTNGVLAACETLLANRNTFSPRNDYLGHIIDLLDSAKEDYYEQRLGNDLLWHTTALGGLCKMAWCSEDDKVLESDIVKALAIGGNQGAAPTGTDVVSLIGLAEDRGILRRRTFGGEIWYRVSPIPSMASYLANMFDRQLARGDAVALELREALQIPAAVPTKERP